MALFETSLREGDKHMSVSFALGLDISPQALFRGMGERSTFICGILQDQLQCPTFAQGRPGSTAWRSAADSVIATVRYADADSAAAFERLSGVFGRLLVSFDWNKRTDLYTSLISVFAAARAVLLKTQCNAAFNYEWDCVILQRIKGSIKTFDVSSKVFRGADWIALGRLLDLSQ